MPAVVEQDTVVLPSFLLLAHRLCATAIPQDDMFLVLVLTCQITRHDIVGSLPDLRERAWMVRRARWLQGTPVVGRR